MEYNPDIFYKTNILTKSDIRKLLNEAKELSTNWWVDGKLDGSWTRKPVDMSFKQIMSCFNKTKRAHLHITFIHRRGYENWEQYLEIGFCTLLRKWRFSDTDTGGDLFLWIDVDLKYKNYLTQKYFGGTDNCIL